MNVTISWLGQDDAAGIADQLIALLAELSPASRRRDADVITDRLHDDGVREVVATVDGHLVGTATLALLVTLTAGPVGRVEDVVVSEAARGSGVGRLLMDALHDEARRLGLSYLELTSRPGREAANGLYVSMGYERRETNVYRLGLRG